MNLKWLFSLIAVAGVAGAGGYHLGYGKGADKSLQLVAGEKNLSSLVIIKALSQIRAGRTNDVLELLETTLDVNVIYIGERRWTSPELTNIFGPIRHYRHAYPGVSTGTQTNEVIHDRRTKANAILGLSTEERRPK